MKIKEVLERKDDLLSGEPAKEIDIKKAEKELNLHFAKEYKEYLLEYGVVAYSGHEITGIVDDVRMNVVSVTQKQKKKSKEIPEDFYVIEVTNIDGIIVWQNSKGMIYSTVDDRKPRLMDKSLSAYFSKQ